MVDDFEHEELVVDLLDSRDEVERGVALVDELELLPLQEITALGGPPDDHGADLRSPVGALPL